MISKEKVPSGFHGYCIRLGEEIVGPDDFGCMPIGWYLNHSKDPNAAHEDFLYYASRDIRAGEEILIDYETLEEGDKDKENFYK
jgi:hypothetical protein